MFDATSRYAGLEVAKLVEDGSTIAYLRRRFLPAGRSLPLLVEVAVKQSDRLDLIAWRTLGDPEHFWRVCDASDAMNPFELMAEQPPGGSLRVPVPQP